MNTRYATCGCSPADAAALLDDAARDALRGEPGATTRLAGAIEHYVARVMAAAS